MSGAQVIFGGMLAIVGAAIGFVMGGPAGAYYGAGVGMAIGMGMGYIIDPMQVPQAGKPQTQEFQIMDSKEGLVIPDVLGTTKCTGNLLHYFGTRSSEVKEKSSGGKGGGKGGGSQVVGYKYYLSWQMGICLGPATAIFSIFMDQQNIWNGLEQYNGINDYSVISIQDYGNVSIFWGTNTQTGPPVVAQSLLDPTLNIPYRGLCYAYFDNFYIGEVNRCPTMFFIVNKMPDFAFNSHNQIMQLEYNPAHAIYYILRERLGLPDSFIDLVSFSAAADRLYAEEFGIGLHMGQSLEALSWISNILKTIDGMLIYQEDGKLHLKLLRGDDNIEDILSISDPIMLTPLDFDRPAWLDTINQVRILYPLRNECEGVNVP